MMASPCPQGSQAWFHLRCGRATASRIADLMARTRTGWAASRANYRDQLVVERLTGTVEPSYPSAAMRWGIEKEPEARTAYRFYHDRHVAQVDFVLHPEMFMAGASPDGLVVDDGLVEIKCPNSATHIEMLRTRSISDRYQLQMLWQMACTGRAWCDFVSYDPRLPEALRLFVQRFERDDGRIAVLEEGVRAFLAEIDEAVASVEGGPATLLAPEVDHKIVALAARH